MTRRRRDTANELVTIFWRDIPAQVKATNNGETGSWLLDERFQVAIDRAATVAGLTTTDDYVLQWRRVTKPCDGDPQSAAQTEAKRLQTEYNNDRVRKLVEAGGLSSETEQERP